MKNFQNSDFNFEQLYRKIPPEVQKTLTQEQLKAIKSACGSSNNSSSHHALDLRLSSPIPGLRFYIVLLAGKERRSKQRLQYERSVYPLHNPVNIFFLFMLLVIFSTSSYTIFKFIFNSFSLAPAVSHPTSIPWIYNELDCKHTKRIWHDNKCWDEEHSPNF